MGAISNISANAAVESVLAAKQSATHSKIAVSVASKALNAQRAAGDAAIALIESAGRIGQAEGRGVHFDSAG